MDTLTQIALGATVAEAGFRHRLGGKAVVLGAACGLLPDLDMLARLGGEFASLVHHRGITHSLITLTLLSPLVGYAGYRWSGRTDKLLTWMHLAFWALLTHPLLDLFTTYGTQLLAPFSDRRFALDAVSVVDLVCSLPIWGVALWSFIRIRRGPSPRRRWVAAGALVFSTCYLFIAYGLSQAAAARAERQLRAEGFTPVEVRAMPTMLVTGAWRVAARNKRGDIRLGVASSWAGQRITFRPHNRPADPLVAKALASKHGRIFLWFTGGLLRARVKTKNHVRIVVLEDVRFGLTSDLRASVFRVRFEYDRNGRLRRVHRLPRFLSFSGSKELRTWWSVLTTGNPP